jgi:multidrug efflux pump subunit AcrA (membrane-fusion protein)
MTDPLAELSQLRIDRTSPRPPRPWGKITLGVLIAAGVVGAGAYGLRVAQGSLLKPEVEVTEIGWVSPAQATIDLTSTGYVVPQRVAKVGAKVTGRITKVSIREGQEVKSGELLFDLDPTDQKSAVASAQARVLAAQARAQTARAQAGETKLQYEREKKLAATGAVGTATVDDLSARSDSQQELPRQRAHRRDCGDEAKRGG